MLSRMLGSRTFASDSGSWASAPAREEERYRYGPCERPIASDLQRERSDAYGIYWQPFEVGGTALKCGIVNGRSRWNVSASKQVHAPGIFTRDRVVVPLRQKFSEPPFPGKRGMEIGCRIGRGIIGAALAKDTIGSILVEQQAARMCFSKHPFQRDLRKTALLFRVAASNVAMYAGKPHLFDVWY